MQLSGIRLYLVVAIGLVLVSLGGCYLYDTFFKSEEDKIREVFAVIKSGFKDRHPARISACLSEEFRGLEYIDKDTAHRALVSILMGEFRGGEVQLAFRPKRLEVMLQGEDQASLTFEAFARARHQPNANWTELNKRAGGTRFKALMKREDGDWRMLELKLAE